MYDGLVIQNSTDHRLILMPYRADGLAMRTFPPSIGPGEFRLINNDHVGDADYYIVAAFMDGAAVPPKIDAKSMTSSWAFAIGGGFVVSGTGGSFSFGGGSGSTSFFSDPMAGTIISLRKKNVEGEFGDNEIGTNAEYEIREIPVHALLKERQNLEITDSQGNVIERERVPVETKVWDFNYCRERPANDERETHGW